MSDNKKPSEEEIEKLAHEYCNVFVDNKSRFYGFIDGIKKGLEFTDLKSKTFRNEILKLKAELNIYKEIAEPIYNEEVKINAHLQSENKKLQENIKDLLSEISVYKSKNLD